MSRYFFIFLLLFCHAFTFSAVDTDALMGQQYFHRGQLNKAAESFEKTIRKNSDHLEANYSLGKIYFLQQRWFESFHYLRETLALKRDYKDTAALFEQVVEKLTPITLQDVNKREELMVQGYILLRQKKMPEAKTSIEKYLRLYPDDGFAWDHLANFYYLQEKLDEAMKYLKKAMSLSPNSPTVFSHYQNTWHLLKHGSPAPEKQPSQDTTNINSIADAIVNQQIQAALAEKKEEQEKKELLEDPEIKKLVQESSNATNNLYAQIMSQQKNYIEKGKPKEEPKQEEKPPEPTYQPLPETIVDTAAEEKRLIEKARLAYADKDWNLAYTTYEILSHNNPRNAEYKTYYENARSYSQFEVDFDQAKRLYATGRNKKENYTEAENAFKKLDKDIYLKLYKKTSFDDFLGKIAYATGRFSQAESLFESWLQQEPKDLDIYYLLLRTQNILGHYKKAASNLKAAIAIDKDDITRRAGIFRLRVKLFLMDYWWIILIVLALWGVATLGYGSYKTYKLKKQQNRKDKFERVRKLAGEQRWMDVVRAIDELLLWELSASEVYNLQSKKANALFHMKQYVQAERTLKSILAKQKNDQQALALLGRIYAEHGHTDYECLESYRILASKDPGNLSILKLYLKTLKQAQMLGDEAEKIAVRILEVESFNAEVLQDLVDIYVKNQTRTTTSALTFKNFLQFHPTNTMVLLNYMETLVELGNFIEAIKVGKQLIDINPDHERVHQLLVKSFDQLSMYDEMKSYYHQLTMDYTTSGVVQNMYNLIQTSYKSGAGVTEEAKDELSQAEAAYTQGVNLLNKGELDDAAIKLQIASNDSRFKFDSIIRLCRIHLEKSDFKSALFYFEQLNIAAHKLDETAMDVSYEIADKLEKDSEYRRSLKLFETLAKKDGSYKDVFQKIESLRMHPANS